MELQELAAAYRDFLAYVSSGLFAGWRGTTRRSHLVTWSYFQPTGAIVPRQGWKIHITTSAYDARATLATTLPILRAHAAPFKLPATLQSLLLLNSGQGGETQIGKIVTVYPPSEATFPGILTALEKQVRANRGPIVLSDLRRFPQSPVSFRYGVFWADAIDVDSIGRPAASLRRPDGRKEEDVRALNGQQPQWATPPVGGPFIHGDPCWSNDAEEITIGRQRFLPIYCMSSTRRNRVLLGLDLQTADAVVIKQVRSGVSGDPTGRDGIDRLHNEARTLNRLAMARFGAPRLRACFDSTTITTLVMDDVPGERFVDLSRDRQLKLFPAIAAKVRHLHQCGFSHRDLKPENLIVIDDTAVLIDFELAADLSNTQLLAGGTPGFLPKNDAYAALTWQRDVYGLALILFYILVGFSPARLPLDDNLARHIRILRFGGFQLLGDMLGQLDEIQGMSLDEGQRLIGDLANVSSVYCGADARRRTLTASSGDVDLVRWAGRAAGGAALATRSFAIGAREVGSWRNNHLHPDHLCRGINIGAAGIIIGLAAIARALQTTALDEDIRAGARFLTSKSPYPEAHGLFTGNAGIALALGVAGYHLDTDEFLPAAMDHFNHAVMINSGFDLFSGAAGVLYTASVLHEITKDQWPIGSARPLVPFIIGNALRTDGVIGWPPAPLYDGERGRLYYGAAHGSAGVALALARFAQCDERAAETSFALDVFASILAHGRDGQGRLYESSSGKIRPQQHWCHGAAGAVWCILQDPAACTAFEDEIAQLLVHVADESALLDNPTVCHGVAGKVELWRMLSGYAPLAEEAHSALACEVKRLELLGFEHQGNMVWASEHPQIITPDLWVGFLGTAANLALFTVGDASPLLDCRWLYRGLHR